ncbi:MAG TPA: hypothetical protein DCY12_08830 [Candidatus Atribacteria bacterium]|nr:hypothetical protein [Candidatus Atribacteria bacterium]
MQYPLKNVIKEIARLILCLLTPILIWFNVLMISEWWKKTENKPWATIKGVTSPTKKECRDAARYHGPDALTLWHDGEAWRFSREINGGTVWCKAFAYKENPKK